MGGRTLSAWEHAAEVEHRSFHPRGTSCFRTDPGHTVHKGLRRNSMLEHPQRGKKPKSRSMSSCLTRDHKQAAQRPRQSLYSCQCLTRDGHRGECKG